MKYSASRLPALSLCFLSLLAITGAAVYLLIGLTPLGIILMACASIAGTIGFFFYIPTPAADKQAPPSWNRTETLLVAAYAILFVLGGWLLCQARSDRPLITPWEVIPTSELLFYGGASFCLLWLSLQHRLRPWLTALHYLWTFSIALVVYGIGYGFDPFIHQAAVKAIEENGRVYPITLYYLGQYGLVAFFHSLFGSTIAFWDKLLVPVLAGLAIPLALYRGLGKRYGTALGACLILLLAFPFTIFIVTTPQNLAYLFVLLAVAWSLRLETKADYALVWLLALAAAVTQPIAGIPALIFSSLITIPLLLKKSLPRRVGTYSLWTLGVIALPATLYLFTAANPETAVALGWPRFDMFAWLIPENPNSESWQLNLAYLFGTSRGLIFTVLAAIGIIRAWKAERSLVIRYALPATAFILSAIAASAINFQFLIEYERADYPQRLLVIAAVLLIPFVLDTLVSFWKRLRASSSFVRAAWLIVLAALLSASLYLSYPRFDHYHNSRGYAASKADVLAVNWIDGAAGGEDYVVLANQQVSAAALRELGFKRYYPGDIFFYPIPTGGPLYQLYLSMIEKPSLETIEQVRALAGVKRVYFVVNDYWWAAEKIIAEAALLAQEQESISNGQVTIFEFSY